MMIFPQTFGLVAGISGFSPRTDYHYAGILAGALLIGWAVLLTWADRKPFKRKDVLLITICPVLMGLIINDIIGLANGFLLFASAMLFLGIKFFLVILFALSYLKGKEI
jgi:hypothetical protein